MGTFAPTSLVPLSLSEVATPLVGRGDTSFRGLRTEHAQSLCWGPKARTPRGPATVQNLRAGGRCGGSLLRRWRLGREVLAQGSLWWWGSLSWGVANFGINTWIN